MLPFNIRKELFWDINTEKIDASKNVQIIVERILSYGNISEFRAMLNYYGQQKIIENVKKIGYLDPKTLEFVISYFHIKSSDLLCYSKKQLNPQHWH